MTPTSAPDLLELLPCPFCSCALEDYEDNSDYYYHPMNGCTIEGTIHLNTEWNTRPQSEASAEALNELDRWEKQLVTWSYGFKLEEHKAQEEKARRVIKTLRAALATPVPVGWRPIETAPRDKVVFVITEQGEMGLATKEEFGWSTHGIVIHCGKSNKPTHWQPLPAPPHTEERG